MRVEVTDHKTIQYSSTGPAIPNSGFMKSLDDNNRWKNEGKKWLVFQLTALPSDKKELNMLKYAQKNALRF